MKNYFLIFTLFLVGLILHLGSSNSYSGFLIKLKNGRAIYVEEYRVEGNHIVFYQRDGEIKIYKDEAQSITEEKGRPVIYEREETKEIKKETPKKVEGKKPVGDLGMKKGEVENYKQKKVELSKKLEDAKKIYFSITDKLEKVRARKGMISISKELFALQEEVKKKNDGVLPEWWEEPFLTDINKI